MLHSRRVLPKVTRPGPGGRRLSMITAAVSTPKLTNRAFWHSHQTYAIGPVRSHMDDGEASPTLRPCGQAPAARGHIHRAYRGQHRIGAAEVCEGRVRRPPRVRHPGAWFPETALRRLRSRQAAGVQLQTPRVLPVVRRAAHVADSGAPGRSCHSARAGAPVGAVTADSAARAAGRAARAHHAGAAGGAACDHAPSADRCRAVRRRGSGRRGHADPALRLGGQPQHPPALSGAGRCVPLRR